MEWRLTDEEGDGVEDVAEDELQRERVDAEALADPGEQPVDRRDERDDGEHVRAVEERRGSVYAHYGRRRRGENAQDLAGNDETEDGAPAEGMEGVSGFVLLVTAVDGDAAASDGLV